MTRDGSAADPSLPSAMSLWDEVGRAAQLLEKGFSELQKSWVMVPGLL